MDINDKEVKKGKHQRIGELLLEQGIVTGKQLQDALKVQNQTGRRLGSVLVELGYVDIDTLLNFFGKQFGVKTANLKALDIDPNTIKRVPFEKLKKHKVLPLVVTGKNVTLAMVNPKDYVAIRDLEFLLGGSIQPVVVLSSQLDATLKMLEESRGKLEGPVKGLDVQHKECVWEPTAPPLKNLLQTLLREKGSDLLITAGVPACIKKDNQVVRLGSHCLTPDQARQYALNMITEDQKNEFERTKELDFAYTFPDIGRFRVNIYMQRSSVSIAMRTIVEDVPDVENLGIGNWIEPFALKSQGLILITGPVGHGKTTSMAALIDIVNSKRRCNIISIEDPIEYLHRHKMSNVNQREVGVDTSSFYEGLKHIFREAPDVIVVGEIRDAESCAIALQAAETGHLVMSTLHSATSTAAIDRITDLFPTHQQQQIRVQLAENFLLILNQRLVPLKAGSGRILAYEKLINTYRVRNLIREGKTHQIRSLLQQSSEDFSSIDHYLARLCMQGKITREAGQHFCDNAVYYNEMVNKGTHI